MKIKLLTCVTDLEHAGFKKLEASLKMFNYDYKIFHDAHVEWSWGGWKYFYEWAKEQQEGYTHLIGMDGFDTLAFAPVEEVIEKYKHPDCFMYSCEKACFPITEWAESYPQVEPYQRWRFLNAGQFISPLDKFIDMYEHRELIINSQHWGHKKYLWDNKDGKIMLDNNCDIFQSVAFLATDEFSSDGHRLVNNLTGTKPVFAHFNGHSDGSWVYDILGV